MPNPENLIGKGFKPGQSGNPKGKAKGTKDWATVVRSLLEDEELFEKVMKNQKKPDWLDALPKKNGSHAVAMAMMIKALGGDKKAADWIRKTGFGEKLVHDFDHGLFAESKMQITVVKSKNADNDKSDA